MINEDKIREACASDKEYGFKLLMENFQQPIYWHIRRLVVSHEDAEDILQEVFIRVFRHLDRFRKRARWAHGCIGLQPMNVSVS